MTLTLIALLACASVNNGNPTSAGSPRDVSYGDLFASDAGDGGSGGGGGGGSDDSGSGDTGAWDTGSWDTGGGGGGVVGEDGEYAGSVTIAFISSQLEFGCDGTAAFVVRDGTYYGYGSCDTDYGDTVSLAWGEGLVQIAYPDYECAVTETFYVDGMIAWGDAVEFGGSWDLQPCDAPALYEFEGTVAFD